MQKIFNPAKLKYSDIIIRVIGDKSLFMKRALIVPVNVISLILLLILPGCAIYRPLPLNNKTIAKASAPPALKEIEKNSKVIKNPLVGKVSFKKKLTPSDVALIAVMLNPALKIERDSIGISKAGLIQAGLLPNPVLGFYFAKPVSGNISGANEPYTAYGFSPAFNINSLFLRGTKIKAAKFNLKAKEMLLLWNEWQIAQSAKLGTINFILLSRELKLYEDIENISKKRYKLINKSYKARLIGASEKSTAEIRLFNAMSDVISLKKAVSNEKIQIYKMLNLPYGYKLPLEKNISFKIKTLILPAKKRLISNIEKRLDLIAFRFAYESREQSLREAILAQFPSIDVSFPFASDTSNVQTFGVGVSINFPVFNRNQGKISAEKASRKMMFDGYINRIIKSKLDINRELSNINLILAQYKIEENNLSELYSINAFYNAALKDKNVPIFKIYSNNISFLKEEINLINLKLNLLYNLIALEISSGKNINYNK